MARSSLARTRKPLVFEDENYQCIHPSRGTVFLGGGPERHCIFCQETWPSIDAWEDTQPKLTRWPEGAEL